MSTQRAVWFVTALAVAVPVMAVMFREDGRFTSQSWTKGLIFGTAVAIVAAIAAGRARQ
ncbi:hypothetical protein OHA37_12030 [Streptomyces sp. NBC_00335]|uniref:hypothetical protein n=1 Tax=unclassified Streptomyces TaxID=2593676 RepID=UPI00224F7F4B|nr:MULTISPECIES: hypothetical protein [unclassified Streptomyces]MCX5404608.1 hypothetical protein [Streptomyces sp. NBC_00086]